MDKEEYLYGAAVQGIQQFIFQTSELKDIIGASELVEQICTTEFEEFGGDTNNSIQRAAGQIKHLFSDAESCKKAVLEFPKRVMTKAPGITISQAVVNMKGKKFDDAIDELESKLKIQRNKPVTSNTIGFMGILRSRKTGLPCIDNKLNDKDNWLDTASYQKKVASEYTKLADKCFGKSEKLNITKRIDQLTSNNDWIAIIHADGNGVGRIVQQIGKKCDLFKEFSISLNQATVNSAQEAFKAIHELFDDNKPIPMRPIVLGGDDLTIVIRGDLAIKYTTKYLEAFEKQTKALFTKIAAKQNDPSVSELLCQGLTACAGISFIKSSYPFYYGYDLAEALCKHAKDKAKKINEMLAPSCIMFHKIQDSFIETFDHIIKRELSIKTIDGYKDYFLNGPYYLHKNNKHTTIDELTENQKLLETKEGNAIKSHLRQWISMKLNNNEFAHQKIDRVISMISNKRLEQLVKDITKNESTSPVYDLLTLITIHNQTTK